jgi:hypothetical protein
MLFPCQNGRLVPKLAAMSHCAKHLFLAALAVSVLLQAKPAFAASRQPRERAARKACLTGDPAKGVSILADLFLDTNDPTYIFNQGRCFEQNRRYDDAIARFSEYLVTTHAVLSREDREAAEKHIATCRETLARERGSASATTPPQPSTPSPPPVQTPEPAPTPEPSRPIVFQPAPEPQPLATHGNAGLRTAGIVSASVGVAAVVAAVILNVKANSKVNEIETTSNGYSPAKVDERNTYETLSWVGYGLGAACVATGAVLFGIGLKSGGSSSTSVALLPALGAGQAGVLLTGGF